MTVLKRKDVNVNPWYYKFKVGGELHRHYGFASRAEAEDAEAKERLRLKTITTHTAFIVAVNKRLDLIKAYSTKGHYVDSVTLLSRFIEWENLLLEEINSEMVRNRLIAISKEKGNSNANKTLRAIKAVFQQALIDGLILRNPCFGIKPFPVDKKPKFIPTKEQISQILLLAKPMDRAYLIAIWLTAARVREINNLTWEDVDFESRSIRLWTRKKAGGSRSPRVLEMVDRVYDSLKYVSRHSETPSPYVFNNPVMVKRYPDNPEKWKYDYRDKFLDSLCQKAGIPEFGYHALRHHAASALADAHISLTAIQEILGHEAATTTNIYLQSLGKAAANGLRAIE
jgi:integrase